MTPLYGRSGLSKVRICSETRTSCSSSARVTLQRTLRVTRKQSLSTKPQNNNKMSCSSSNDIFIQEFIKFHFGWTNGKVSQGNMEGLWNVGGGAFGGVYMQGINSWHGIPRSIKEHFIGRTWNTHTNPHPFPVSSISLCPCSRVCWMMIAMKLCQYLQVSERWQDRRRPWRLESSASSLTTCQITTTTTAPPTSEHAINRVVFAANWIGCQMFLPAKSQSVECQLGN